MISSVLNAIITLLIFIITLFPEYFIHFFLFWHCIVLTCHLIFFYVDFCLGGVFKLELFLPEEYPMAPPKVNFYSLKMNA